MTSNDSKNDAKIAVFGIFHDRAQAEGAIQRLTSSGYLSSDISVLFPDKGDTKDFAHEKATKAPEGAAAGVGTGAVVGGTLGLLAGIGVLAIPGIGPFIAAGPIMASLAGLGVGGAVGGLAGALIGMGIPEYEAKRYASVVNGGGILMSIHTTDSESTKKAKTVLEQCGAKDVSSTGEAHGGKPEQSARV